MRRASENIRPVRVFGVSDVVMCVVEEWWVVDVVVVVLSQPYCMLVGEFGKGQGPFSISNV